MIPLVWFLAAWFLAIAIFGLMTFLTVVMNVRYGLSSTSTYMTTAGFLIVIAIVLLETLGFLTTVDWTQSVSVFASAPPNLGL